MEDIKDLWKTSSIQDLSTQQTLTIIGLAGLTAILISWIPIVNWLDYPFRLLNTLVHELGHGIAALITGGDFSGFTISLDGSGRAYSSGWRLIVAPAGYLSVAIFAAGLTMLGRSHRFSRLALAVIGSMMILLTLCYARPDAFTFRALSDTILTLGSGLIFGAIFLKIAKDASPGGIIFFLHLIAIKAGLTAFADIFTVIRISSLGASVHTDAQTMANLTGIPAIIWGILWVIISFTLIGSAIWSTWLIND